ncbi:MAG: ribosomal protein large subunit ribosomal protein [Candidatus Kaiserbacteria bacterium]|nr:ribosomal protein large subunit ribosomal protein [Candidatus Kaiserbacteria bacterium]
MTTTKTTKKTDAPKEINMEATIFNTQGKKSGTLMLPESVFGVKWNDSLVHQVVTSMMDNARTPVAHTKTRGDVRGGGKKPWRQKGTGRARHGSIRSPIWRGGGVTHGPRNDKVYARAIPKKMRAKALFMVLSRKFKEGKVIFVDSFGVDTPKTAVAVKAIRTLATIDGMTKLNATKNAALIAFADPTSALVKSFQNIGSVEGKAVRELNPVSVLKYKFLILENPEAALAIIENRAQRTKPSLLTSNKKS